MAKMTMMRLRQLRENAEKHMQEYDWSKPPVVEAEPVETESNDRRARIGARLTKAYESMGTSEDAGRGLLDIFMKIPGEGDEYDIRSTVVDAAAAVLHHSLRNGCDLEEIRGAVAEDYFEGENGAVARIVTQFRPVLEEVGEDFDRAFESALECVRVEAGVRSMRR